jgi:hypothetical protein
VAAETAHDAANWFTPVISTKLGRFFSLFRTANLKSWCASREHEPE